MKVVIKPLKSFVVETEDGVSLGTFVKTSQWNGMTELRHDREVLIIHTGQTPFAEMLDGMFETSQSKTVDVVKASPAVVAKLSAGQEGSNG